MKEVIEKGWGKRHSMAGTMLLVGYIMLHTPKDNAEVNIMQKIFKASVRIMTCDKAVK
jgi:hypothetical protein